ncbi:MAG: septal ring lytic transglycosylase RlpA family protein [Candidatus Aminicenantes bacterium]|nr:septal ring lytic transglycosylase RlpA family protein [Candidatus Aminicenantes bacterium]
MSLMKAFAAGCSVLLMLLGFGACARIGRPRVQPPPGLAAPPQVFQTGIASWYGEDFHGRTTANGETYDMHKLTAAHLELPFHTLVEVENLENGEKVLVRINDRGPFLKERIIDLSLKAARRLDMAEQGTAAVALRVVRWGGAAAGTAPAADPFRGCVVQTGAFTLRANAEEQLQTLGELLPGLAFRVVEEGGLFKVLSAEPSADPACREVLRLLAAHGMAGFVRAAPLAEGK